MSTAIMLAGELYFMIGSMVFYVSVFIASVVMASFMINVMARIISSIVSGGRSVSVAEAY